MSARVRIGGHSLSKIGELLGSFPFDLLTVGTECLTSDAQKLVVESGKTLHEGATCFATHTASRRAGGVERLRDAIDQGVGVRAERARCTRVCQPKKHALQVNPQPGFGRWSSGTFLGPGFPSFRDRSRRQTSRTPPLVEDIEDVGFAEVNLDRPPPRTFAVVTREVAIDAAERDLDRHAVCRPPRHEIERRPDDADQMAVVFLAEIRFDLSAVIGGLQSNRQSEINP